MCGCGVTLWNIHHHEADKLSDIFVEFDWSLDSIFSITVGPFLSVCVWQPQRILFFFWYIDFVTWNDSHFLYILFREIKMSKGQSQQNVGFHGCFNSRGTWKLKLHIDAFHNLIPFILFYLVLNAFGENSFSFGRFFKII